MGKPLDLVPYVALKLDPHPRTATSVSTARVAIGAVADWCDGLSRVKGGGIRGFIGAIFLRATAALLRDRARIARPK